MSTGIVNPGKLNGCILWHDFRRLTALDYGPLGNVYPLTLYDNPTLDPSLGLVLNGTTQYARHVGSETLLNATLLTNNFTLVCRCKPTSGAFSVLCGKSDLNGLNEAALYYRNVTFDRFVCIAAGPATNAIVYGPSALTFGDEYQVGMTVTAGVARLYRNGVIHGTPLAYTGNCDATATNWTVGSRNTAPAFLVAGSIASDLVFSRPLTSTEMLNLYTSGI